MIGAAATAGPVRAVAGSRADVEPWDIPADIRAQLSPEQVARLLQSLPPRMGAHAVDYRVSTSMFGRGFYIALVAGGEKRPLRRLRHEGLKRALPAVLFEVATVCLAVAMMVCLLVGVSVVAAYIVKSAMGIDLMDGPSFLHDLFYWH